MRCIVYLQVTLKEHLFSRFGLESTSDNKDQDTLVPTPNPAAIGGYTNLGNRHRVKRGGMLGVFGKTVKVMYGTMGTAFKKMCLVPVVGWMSCPVFLFMG